MMSQTYQNRSRERIAQANADKLDRQVKAIMEAFDAALFDVMRDEATEFVPLREVRAVIRGALARA